MSEQDRTHICVNSDKRCCVYVKEEGNILYGGEVSM